MRRIVFIIMTCLSALAVNAETDNWEKMKEVYNSIKAPVFPDRDFLITDFHVSSDTLYTKAINSAIGACHAAGGGRVVIPAGEYVTAPITLRSNVNLHLEEGAVLKFTLDTSLSNIVLTRIEGIDCYNWQPLIYAYGEENIAITGKGTLDGQGTLDSWWSPKLRHNIKLPDGRIGYEKTLLNECLERQDPIDKRIFKGSTGMRPQFINLYRCKNILLEDFTIIRSPFWLIHPLLSENIIVRGVTMNSHGANNDGCDPESCKNVIIENCTIDTGDDCIAIKSGKDADGRRWNIPSENIIVRNCVMKDGHAAVAMGSEITGGCRNVWVEDCKMDSPNLDRIIRIKSNPVRGGVVENVYVRNLEVGECKLAILGIELKYWKVTEGDFKPLFQNIYIDNINSKKSQYMVSVDGFEDSAQAKNIFFSNCDIQGVTNKKINNLVGQTELYFNNVKVNGKNYKHKANRK